jgi:geranylgeranyl pyrophosphate synthase
LAGSPYNELIGSELQQVDAVMREPAAGQHEAISVALDHLVGAGGKRLRPALVLLSAHVCGAPQSAAVTAAAGVELLHTATLVHDDLIDHSLMRRGSSTLNALWSPGATVLTGDYLFARSAYLIAGAGSVRLLQRFAETLMVLCNGEVTQMFNGCSTAMSRKRYEQRIRAKTGSLMAFSCESGAILADCDGVETRALRLYGEELGLAFQIVDDVLDFAADEVTLGKPVGSDLRHRLVTLPLLFFLETQPEHLAVQQALQGARSEAVLAEAVQAVAESTAIPRALSQAQAHVKQAKEALGCLPESPYRASLHDLADFVVRRTR